MKKKIILIMQADYPFGQFQSQNHIQDPSVQPLVRKIHEANSTQAKNQILQKISILRTLPIKQLIKIQNVLEQQNNVHLLYEYVPTKFTTFAKIQNDHILLKTIKEHIISLGSQLAAVGIIANWHIDNLGLNKNFECKYHLDIDKSKLVRQYDRKKIEKLHIESINQMFEPYVGEKQKELKTRKNSSSPSKKDINAFYENHTQLLQQNKKKNRQTRNNMKKSKNHWKQIEQDDEILRDFINVLDDQSEVSNKNPSDEEIIWKQNEDKKEEEQMIWVESQEIRRKANQAIERSLKAIKTFREVVLKRSN